MIDFTKAKAIVEFELDAKDFKDGAKQVQRASQDTTRSIEGIGISADEARSMMEKLAERASGAMGGLTSAIEKGRSGVRSFLGGIDDLAKGMSPWNQALELGGKALNVLNDGLDAYAKTSPNAAAEVKKLTDEFTNLKMSAMAALGEITVGALKALPALSALQDPLAWLKANGGATTGSGKWDAFTNFKLPTGNQYNPFASGQVNPFSADYNPLGYQDYNPWEQGIDPANGRVDEGSFFTFVNGKLSKIPAPGGSVKSRGADTAGDLLGWSDSPMRAQMRANYSSEADLEKWLGKPDKSVFASLGDLLKQAPDSIAGLAGLADGLSNVVKAATEDVPQQSLLERLGLHNPTAMDMASAAVQSFASSYAESMQAIGESSASGAEIFKHMTGNIVRTIGGQLAAKGAAETVEGGAMLLTGNPMGAAHLGAAALYSAGAVAAYAAASQIDNKGGGPPGRAGGGSAAGSSTGSYGSQANGRFGGDIVGGNEKSQNTRPVVVVLGSSFDETTPRQRARAAQDAIDQALRLRDE